MFVAEIDVDMLCCCCTICQKESFQKVGKLTFGEF